uniref:CARD domain-containing protein n=2 Tax=Oreochromis aureus TaxID=47969 RepID=A0AAZ1Y2M2_OREAU
MWIERVFVLLVAVELLLLSRNGTAAHLLHARTVYSRDQLIALMPAGSLARPAEVPAEIWRKTHRGCRGQGQKRRKKETVRQRRLEARRRKMMKEPVEEPPIKEASSAAEELATVRTEFVSRVSTEILTQLLEALVTAHVFNDLEKRRILEGNPVTADRARCTIDIVINKGNKASRIMISHLCTKDPCLWSELCSSSDQQRLLKCKRGNNLFLRHTF